RSLGLELGGAIGIPLFLCRTLSITFYSFGFAESLISLWPAAWGPVPGYLTQLLAAVTIILITAVAGKSAELTLKLQIPILVAVGLSLVALVIGVFAGGVQAPRMEATYATADGHGFWYVFAVFFPAVTGFTAGIGMSGDLKDPRQSIPRGTLGAVLNGTAVYLVVPVLLSISVVLTPELLTTPGAQSWIAVAFLGAWLIYPGIWGAILSSAFGSVLGGPRVLQALATDGLAPNKFAQLSATGQPTRATWVAGGIALLAVALGGLNTVATLVTVLFLTLYVMVNLSAALEQLTRDPYYRPTIRVPWQISILGALGAIGVMFLISPLACLVAAILELSLWLYLRRRSLEKRWGDVRAGLWLSVARFALLNLKGHKSAARNWRPLLLTFVRDPSKDIGLVRLASWFNQDRGVVTVCQLVLGDLKDGALDVEAERRRLDAAIEPENVQIFPEVDVVSHYESGAIGVTQANGIAGIRSNTALFNLGEDLETLASRLRVLRAVARVGTSGLLAKVDWRHRPGDVCDFDIWWDGLENNGDLMLLFAYLLSLNKEWKNARIRVLSVVESDVEATVMEESLRRLIPELRIRAEAETVIRAPGESLREIVHRESADAAVVFLGLAMPKAGDERDRARQIVDMAAGLPTTIYVHSGGEFAGHLA
ncbi:MAG: hypothetical protein AAFX50_07660, partial [Acidobacteriota bacterium]